MKKIIVTVLVTIICAATVFIGFLYFNPSTLNSIVNAKTVNTVQKNEDPETLVAQIPSKKLAGQTVKFEEITTNLKGTESFIALSLSAVTDSTKSATEATEREFQLENYLIKELSQVTSDQMIDQKFVDEFINKTVTYMNQQMKDGKILKIYITKKVVQ